MGAGKSRPSGPLNGGGGTEGQGAGGGRGECAAGALTGGDGGESLGVTESLQRSLDNARAQNGRLTTDFANFRNRSADERMKTMLYANKALMVALLPILDDFDRATVHLNGDRVNGGDREIGDGILLIRRRLEQLLMGRGLSRMETVGQRFDPFMHQAVQMRPREHGEPGTVVEELVAGYLYHDRVLRAAQVAVVALNGNPAGTEPRAGAVEGPAPAAEPARGRSERRAAAAAVRGRAGTGPAAMTDEELAIHVEAPSTDELRTAMDDALAIVEGDEKTTVDSQGTGGGAWKLDEELLDEAGFGSSDKTIP